MAGEYIFTMQSLIKRYGRNEVLNGINLSFYHGAKLGIVGENGSGKSTLLKIIAGEDNEFEGQAAPLKGATIGFLPQEPVLEDELTVRENVEQAFGDIKQMIEEFNEVSAKMAEPMSDEEMEKAMEKMGRLQDQIDAVDGWELDRQVEVAMDALVLPADDQKAGTLSGGDARRVALCKLLLQKPDMILLDEPTNHLDAETVQWLEEALSSYPGNVIVSTHDRYFLDNITKWILELEAVRENPSKVITLRGWNKKQKFYEGEKKVLLRYKNDSIKNCNGYGKLPVRAANIIREELTSMKSYPPVK